MDTGLNNSRGVDSRRNSRLSKQDRKFNQSRASKIKARYRTAIKDLENADSEAIEEVRKRIKAEEAKRLKKTRLVLGIMFLLLMAMMAVMMV